MEPADGNHGITEQMVPKTNVPIAFKICATKADFVQEKNEFEESLIWWPQTT